MLNPCDPEAYVLTAATSMQPPSGKPLTVSPIYTLRQECFDVMKVNNIVLLQCVKVGLKLCHSENFLAPGTVFSL